MLSLPRPQQQPALERAAAGKWSVAKLREHIQQTKPAPRQRIAKPAAVAKVVADFERLEATHGDRMRAPDLTDSLAPDQAGALADALGPVIEALQALQARLRAQAAADTPERPAVEPAPSPTASAPTSTSKPQSRPKPKPKSRTARPPASRAPTVSRPSRPKPTPKPAPVTASTPNPIEALEDDAGRGMRLVQALLARGVREEELAQAIERSTKAPAKLARKLALLAKLPPRWQEGLLARSDAGRTRSLDDVLRAMKLL